MISKHCKFNTRSIEAYNTISNSLEMTTMHVVRLAVYLRYTRRLFKQSVAGHVCGSNNAHTSVSGSFLVPQHQSYIPHLLFTPVPQRPSSLFLLRIRPWHSDASPRYKVLYRRGREVY